MRTGHSQLFAILLCSVTFSASALAHDPGLSGLRVRARANGVEATLTLAFKDAAQLAELDEDHDGVVTQAEFARGQSRLEAFVAAELVVAPDGKPAKPESVRSRVDENNNVELQLDFRAAAFSKLEIQSKLIASLPPGHRQFLQVQNSGGQMVTERLVTAAGDRATAQITVGNADVAAPEIGGSFVDF